MYGRRQSRFGEWVTEMSFSSNFFFFEIFVGYMFSAQKLIEYLSDYDD